ncbi:hypothetical protein HCU40_08850 [Pseudanabaena biceps]|nr:hypothetical protein [Pseudanabaena biceps]
MASFKVWHLNCDLLAIAGTLLSLGAFMNTGYVNAQVAIGAKVSNALSPAHQMLLDMQQNNAPVGGGSMQIFRFTPNNVSFAPLEGLNSILAWQTPKKQTVSGTVARDRISEFKATQRKQIISDGDLFNAMTRFNDLDK